MAIRLKHSNLSPLDMDCDYRLAHTLLLEKILFVSRKGVIQFQALCIRFNEVDIIRHCNGVPSGLNQLQFSHIEVCLNLVPVCA